MERLGYDKSSDFLLSLFSSFLCFMFNLLNCVEKRLGQCHENFRLSLFEYFHMQWPPYLDEQMILKTFAYLQR